jgi:hypothetical protein
MEGGPALTLQELSILIFIPLRAVHSLQEISNRLIDLLYYTTQLAVFDMSNYDGSDVDIIFAGGGTAAC